MIFRSSKLSSLGYQSRIFEAVFFSGYLRLRVKSRDSDQTKHTELRGFFSAKALLDVEQRRAFFKNRALTERAVTVKSRPPTSRNFLKNEPQSQNTNCIP